MYWLPVLKSDLQVYLEPRNPWFDDLPFLDDEEDRMPRQFEDSVAITGYFSYRRSMFLMCWVFSTISALMYSETLVVKTTAVQRCSVLMRK